MLPSPAPRPPASSVALRPGAARAALAAGKPERHAVADGRSCSGGGGRMSAFDVKAGGARQLVSSRASPVG